MKVFSVLVFLTLLCVQALACSEDGRGGFLPENSLNIPVGFKSTGGLTEEEFNNVIDKVETIYQPLVSNLHGTLRVSRKWTDGTVNANATRAGVNWDVNMYGGLARHSTITSDGFTLVLCHEIGHHLGGAPKICSIYGSSKWATNEGQADYYATLKCLRKVFWNDNNAEVVKKLNAPEFLVKSCHKSWRHSSDKNICIRSGMAGASVTGLFAAISGKSEAKFDSPDSKIVTQIDDNHPAYQCRLDTFFQGALCEKSVNEDVSQDDEVPGTCHASTGENIGLRPLCWFKPSVK